MRLYQCCDKLKTFGATVDLSLSAVVVGFEVLRSC
jgi:hypothetical protein